MSVGVFRISSFREYFFPDNDGLIWPMLTTIATWITFTEINIQQERRGYYYPRRHLYKQTLLLIAVLEIVLLFFMALNICENTISKIVIFSLISVIVFLWCYCGLILNKSRDSHRCILNNMGVIITFDASDNTEWR